LFDNQAALVEVIAKLAEHFWRYPRYLKKNKKIAE
jgi:hypothetical protein